MKQFIGGLIVGALVAGSPVWAAETQPTDWTAADSTREVAWLALNTLDWGQTLTTARHPERYREFNPILGRHPSVGRVNLYMGGWMAVHPLISSLLPNPYRKIWQYVTIAVSGGAVANNFRLGLQIRF